METVGLLICIPAQPPNKSASRLVDRSFMGCLSLKNKKFIEFPEKMEIE
jgi:hypothetical protein